MAKKKSSKKFTRPNLNINFKRVARKPKLSQKHILISATLLGVLLLAVTGWAWWTKIVINPERVLSDAIANSLQTTSVTRQVLQDDGNQKVDQTSYLSFYAPTITAETSTELSQKGRQRQETTITTDTIGTKNVDLVRYSNVEGAENLPGAENFEKLIGIWAKKEADPAKGEQATFLNESLFSIVPIGNLDPEAREQLLELMNEKKLYEYKSVVREIENYRPVYVYTLSVNPADLIEVLALYAQLTGAIDPGQFNPETYANAPAVTVEATVDIASRNITSIRYGNSSRTESFSGYNLFRPIKLPEETITIDELQQRLQGGDSAESQSS
jgi:hypothetical protein